ncbi:HAMP domain-containing sensor histidine kinase [uncultured Paenibacillus sp.]|uniref:HAMP domain-containing sensor histidine kinase n=1 Tax=uncultured Paenibacillus sp. TaxID=227322 RepID=UPI0015B35099|nr:HAMP domain-containing sensor histidine kinase [uncultured Paenibacillus sp.]
MTIKKRLFNYNLLMVVIPLVAMLMIGSIFVFIVKALSSTDSKEIGPMNDSFLEMMSLMDGTDMNGIAEQAEAQHEFMNRFAAKNYLVYAKQDGQTLFSNLSEKEYSYISKYLSQDHLYTATQSLWVPDDDFHLWWTRIETDTTPVTLVVARFFDRGDGSGHTVAFAMISILIISAIVIMVILVSLYFANRIIEKIMVPLNHLCAGAQRIQEGDLSQDISCHGAEELEKVCDSFNQMQHQLKANMKKNEKYERDRNEMLAGISHDLRTPLTSIKSYVKGLQDDVAKTPDKQKEYLDVVYRKACGIESLINSLFLFSRLETDTFPYTFKSVSIQNFIVTLLDSLEYDLKKGNAVLTLNSRCTDQKVWMDGEQMTRAMTNILDNSIKHNPNQQLHITVTLFEENGHVVIRIEDDGAGVSTEQLNRLFDSFYRGDESRNTATQGSGLGLAIAKRIVIAHGGSISAESNHGLAIIIELPVEEEKQ